MKRLYCVYDKVAGIYNPPYPAENEGTAVRAFNNAMEKSPFAADMALYHVGDFMDDTTGEICSVKPEFVCNAEVKQ